MDSAKVAVSLASPESATDSSFVARLVEITNEAYSTSEGTIFVEGYRRTDATEVSQFLKDRQIAIATLPSTGSDTGSSTVIGCIRIQSLSDTHGDFGMLALDPTFQGKGSGRDLVIFAEEECRRRGKTVMQVELLFPTWVEHAGKQRLEAWYQRLGYVLVRTESFQESYPHLSVLLRGECEYRIYEKPLVN